MSVIQVSDMRAGDRLCGLLKELWLGAEIEIVERCPSYPSLSLTVPLSSECSGLRKECSPVICGSVKLLDR